MKKTMIVILVLAFLLFGCMPTTALPEDNPDFIYLGRTLYTATYRYVDKDAGVVCWINGSGGIYCMPLSDTLLKDK